MAEHYWTFWRNARLRRVALGLTGETVAERAGISPDHLRASENRALYSPGPYPDLLVQTAAAVADALKVPLHELLEPSGDSDAVLRCRTALARLPEQLQGQVASTVESLVEAIEDGLSVSTRPLVVVERVFGADVDGTT